MEIRLASITVDDQEKALRFYVDKLGFVKDKDIPMGAFRWLTVSAPEGAAGVELVLERWPFRPRSPTSAHCTKRGFQQRHLSPATSTLNTRGSRHRA